MESAPPETRRAVVSVARSTHAKLRRAEGVLLARGWQACGIDRRDHVTLSVVMDAAADALLRMIEGSR